jgi:hypothetical protein
VLTIKEIHNILQRNFWRQVAESEGGEPDGLTGRRRTDCGMRSRGKAKEPLPRKGGMGGIPAIMPLPPVGKLQPPRATGARPKPPSANKFTPPYQPGGAGGDPLRYPSKVLLFHL